MNEEEAREQQTKNKQVIKIGRWLSVAYPEIYQEWLVNQKLLKRRRASAYRRTRYVPTGRKPGRPAKNDQIPQSL